MINSLFQSSQHDKSLSHFLKENIHFGWDSICKMFKREVARIQNDELPRVPGLKENYVYRDSWTKLNVKPAKIMQVRNYLL